uniref:Uncharacterized protein n=1 Tax=Pyramimonas obovata TaxID=1411642 RepID=A0A7S0WUZ5_9CHLO|mmetsp:Transcript_5535/g.11290  ORF Transcript_5535/g.11290 Transcript_5535/m.11290 type:complete len:432 (+) Transcript_5535:225-1520(+)|eukprot:CAMPEP_0118935488 /NCGR_PEP_ID=MMETSP1169-20130426/15672_1 /TAXON_ID=36882 /ORGANISM="Pyramimonas obovata, Strain CCMP722" /LENGTH=431 /DNA_ID=CAMNT_0006878533 /DNA_START=218 /DNA_END=1513 /DNA_ORIENTATION=+
MATLASSFVQPTRVCLHQQHSPAASQFSVRRAPHQAGWDRPQRVMVQSAVSKEREGAKGTSKVTRNSKTTSEKMTADAKKQALQSVFDSLDAMYGKGTIMKMGDAKFMQTETFPSGSMTLDLALGGGYPKGRIVEIYGPESSGKTTLALHAMAEMQKLGGTAAFIDAEHAFDADYAAALGVNTDDLLVSQPSSGEMALEVVDRLVRSGAVDVIAVDSVAALVPQAEIEGEMGLVQVGTQARLMSQGLRKLVQNASKGKCTVIFINQIRHKIGVFYGSPETTSGGNALKFYASVRIDIRRIGFVKGPNGIEVGNRVRTKIVKNKVARPYQVAESDLMYGTGLSFVGSLLDCAETCSVVDRKGAWYSYGKTRLGQGRDKSIQFLEENPEVCSKIEAATRASQKAIDAATIDEDEVVSEDEHLLDEDEAAELDD